MRRVAVYIDSMNCYNHAREAFHQPTDPSRYGELRPRAFAEMLVEKGDAGDSLVHIGTYRGQPDSRKDPKTAAAFMRQRQAWIDDCGPVLRARSRPMRYLAWRPLSEAEEKGVDVQFAIDAMTMGLLGDYDLAILATCDTDLLPVVEGLQILKEKSGTPDVAVIGWAGTSQHLEIPNVPIRWIGRRDYEVVRDRTDYNLSVSERRILHPR
jgi:uncharacterized LabA/DUF88 family protein